jgi:hypothetical protein
MALALFDRVQETTTTTGTGSVTLAGAVPGFQTFAVVGNGNTCYYTIVDGSAWEVGIGTYSTSGPTLARTTVLSNSNGNTSPITLAAGVKSVFLTYPAGKSVNLNESGNVSPLGTVVSGIWNGTTIGVAYGGTGVTASSGANSVVLRDSNQNIAVNRVNQANTNTTAAGGTTALTAASSYIHTLVGTGGQTYTLPDATTLTTGVAFVFNNLATSTLTVSNYAGTTIGTIPSGGAGAVFLTLNSTVGGTWDLHAYLPEGVTFGTNAFNLGTSIITGGTWQGGTIQTGYGGTGLTTYTSGGAVYANSSSTLTSGTLPISAGGTGNTTGNSATTSQTNFSNLTIGGSQVLYAGNYNSYAPTLTGGGASGTWGINISGNAATATSSTSSTTATTALLTSNSVGGTGEINLVYAGMADNDFARIRVGGTATNAGWLEIATADDGTEPIYFRQYTGVFATVTRTLTLLDASGNTNFPGNVGINVDPLARFHVRQSTPTSLGGLPSGVSMISDSSSNNYLLFRNTADNSTYAGLAFQDNNMGGYVLFGNSGVGDQMYIAGYSGGALQYGTADSINPAARTTVASWNATGLQINNGDMRAPIYYDSNNTAYYGDFAGTSVLNAANWNGVQNWVGDGAYARGTPTYGFRFNNSADTINAFIVNNSGDTTSYSSSRAPIFYDSNNTGYYVNPNSTSNTGGFYLECNAATGRGTYGKPLANLVLNATEASGAGYACIDFKSGGNYPSDGAQIYYESSSSGSGEASRLWLRVENDATDEIYLRAGRIYYNSNTVDGGSQNPGHIFQYAGSDRMYVYSDNTTEVSSFRAPIFYDSNNTGYYTDPSSTSVLNALTLGGRSTNQAMYYQGFTLDANTMDTNATGFTYAVNAPTVGPVARFSTGGGYDLWLNAAYSGGGTNLFFRTRNGDAGSINPWRAIPSYGVNANTDSFFSTIYYDSNNTGYYADFSSTAGDCARFAGGIVVSQGNVTGNGIILADDGDIVDLNDGYCAMRFSSGVRIHSGNRSGGAVILLSSGGSITASNNITAYGSASDRRLKENIQPLTGALDKVMQLQGCTFDWKEDSEQHTMVGLREDIGFIADAVQDVVPTMVREGKDGYLSLRDRGFSALLVEAMKEQQAQIAALRAEINALRAH